MRGLVLAAGFGTRLQPMTTWLPKALVPVCGAPLLAHALDLLASQGFGPVIVNTHHLHEQIAAWLDAHRPATALSYERDCIRGTGGALWYARDFLGAADECFVCNVEPLRMCALRGILDSFHAQRLDAGLLALPAHSDGTIAFDPLNYTYLGTRQHDIDWELAGQGFFIGIAFYSRRFLALLSEEDFSIVPVWRRAQEAGMRVAVLPVPADTYWRDVGTPAELACAYFDVLAGLSPYALPPGLRRDVCRRCVVPAAADAGALKGLGSLVWLGCDAPPEGARLQRVVVLPGARLEAGRRYENMIVSPWGEIHFD